MKHRIDPKVDCVFKALLGSEKNKNLLIHFINAILDKELAEPIINVELLNPYNDKEFIGDKQSIVDVKAKDSFEQVYQIEIQLKNTSYLSSRMIYNWADIYSKQAQEGKNYDLLKPTYSIWLLAENVIKDDKKYAHHYKLRDEQGNSLNQHGGIWLLELNKFHHQQIKNNEQLWLKFFKEGDSLDDELLPEWMQTEEMRQAMNTLTVFSEKERQYDRYQARMEYLRIQNTTQFELEQSVLREAAERQAKEEALLREAQERKEKVAERTAKDQALLREAQERKEKEDALEEIAHLKALWNKQ